LFIKTCIEKQCTRPLSLSVKKRYDTIKNQKLKNLGAVHKRRPQSGGTT